jgi:hypothetical protein
MEIIKLQITMFSDIMPCSLGDAYKHFGGTSYFLLQMQDADVGTRFFRNYGTFLPNYTEAHPKNKGTLRGRED